MSQIDHIAQSESRLATQYRESPNLIGYIAALLSEANSLEQIMCDIIFTRTIDEATGFTLDVIGEIVGQPRILVDATVIGYFGYAGALGAKAYNSGRYRSESEPTTGDRTLDDTEYRLFIRARIARNHSNGTIESIIELTKFITGADEVVVTEYDSAIRIGVGRPLTDSEQIFLTESGLLPKAAGVEIEEFYEYSNENKFAYAAFPNAKGYNTGEYASAI